jgi:hypothetical protein
MSCDTHVLNRHSTTISQFDMHLAGAVQTNRQYYKHTVIGELLPKTQLQKEILSNCFVSCFVYASFPVDQF